MSQSFTIVRDLAKYHYQKGSDRIVLTQFDTGIRLVFNLLENKQPLDLSGYQAFISFFNASGDMLLCEPCVSVQDLSLSPSFRMFYLMDERLTMEAGELKAIVDLIDPEGYRTAINPFTITLLEHLRDEPINLTEDEPKEEETPEGEPTPLPDLP